ncbi:MAG: hypothetical protein AW08_01484 [Candidatus Accumulibacter adjunctus]|uniref:Uncharacterized protein n=1 Tax=Candidatus Accumulibacter adjunctus TaxID=1454001 RepID=A0A011N088_9PROT|nr:MAG: hypothetical protein AW08_01484 [Candidatus Accumulibacter adjunctus]
MEGGQRVRWRELLRDEHGVERQAVETAEATQKPEHFGVPQPLPW